MTTALYIIIALLVVAAIVVAVVLFRSRSQGTDTSTPSVEAEKPKAETKPPAPPEKKTPAAQKTPPVVKPTATKPPAPVDVPTSAPTAATEEVSRVEEVQKPEEVEVPEAPSGRLVRLRERLARSGGGIGKTLLALLSKDHLEDSDWDELEETLLLADVGTVPTDELLERLRTRVRVLGVKDTDSVKTLLREELLTLVGTDMDRSLHIAGSEGDNSPAVVLVVGVNGTGKTTTVGKLARVLVAEGCKVLLGAADTFRAAAADQLTTWGSRVGVKTVRSDKDGADPASVAFDAVRTGTEEGADVVLVDTAGRLQNKAGLMDELGKIKRVIEKSANVDEVLLVLDATTGQNGMNQAKVFSEVVDVTGIVLTKLDGTAKGGIVVAVQRELGVPVKLVGLGEGADDLAPFDPEAFVDAMLV